MRLAIISDIHGNYQALEAVLDDIEREKVDLTVCAGDVINPFPESERCWQQLKTLGVPCVMGNHEGYVLNYHDPAGDPIIREGVNFAPLQYTARRLAPATLAEIKALPLTLTIPGPQEDDVLICHASPTRFDRSIATNIDDELATVLRNTREKTIVAGHFHFQWQANWGDKLLILAGSVGLPLVGDTQAQYTILSHHGDGWQVKHKRVMYNQAAMLKVLEAQNFWQEAGPLGWLFVDELQTGEKRLVPFLTEFCAGVTLQTESEWATWVERYLHKIGRWGEVINKFSLIFN